MVSRNGVGPPLGVTTVPVGAQSGDPVPFPAWESPFSLLRFFQSIESPFKSRTGFPISSSQRRGRNEALSFLLTDFEKITAAGHFFPGVDLFRGRVRVYPSCGRCPSVPFPLPAFDRAVFSNILRFFFYLCGLPEKFRPPFCDPTCTKYSPS